MRVSLRSCLSGGLLLLMLCQSVQAQQEVGFLERFAVASDRRVPLQELIPGTEDYYFFHCLHFQNERRFAEAQSLLEQWRAKHGETEQVVRMHARQMLLSYDSNPQRTLDYLRDRLGLQLDHAPPSRDRAALLSNKIDDSRLVVKNLLDRAIASDRSLSQIETRALPLLVDTPMATDQLRAWLQRLDRADFPGVVKRIAEELALRDSRGFGWAGVHKSLSLKQLDELLALRNNLLENGQFVRSYAARLVPAEGASLEDPKELRAYLNRLVGFTRRLPPSQNSFKALVLGRLLRLNLHEGNWDRGLFLEYLSLPRNLPYYDLKRLANQPVQYADLNFSLNPDVPLPPMGDDTDLVRRYLEAFIQKDDKIDDFAKVLDRAYVERVLAETKILYGLGESSEWYAKLSASEQKELRDRVELRFSAQNTKHYAASEQVQLQLEVKNIDSLTVKIYQINPRNYYRVQNRPISTDIDLDGLVANDQKKLEIRLAADRRRIVNIDLPELSGRGVWVVDVLGGGQRSRALVQKGNLSTVQQLTDVGHVFRVFDEAGQPVKKASIEINNREFTADSKGEIFVPYVAQNQVQSMLVIDGEFASLEKFQHRDETYALQAGFDIDRQSLLAGTMAQVVVRSRLTANGRPTSLRLLEDVKLLITATDADGLSTSQTVTGLELKDTQDLEHRFLVPQRLTQLNLTLSGRVHNQSRDERQDVAASQAIQCNGILATGQIGDFYFKQVPSGYRVMVLGRNGEAIAKLPVTASVKTEVVTTPENFTLATDANGAVELGTLSGVSSISVSAQGLQGATFNLAKFHRHWPAQIHVAETVPVRLALGKEESKLNDFSLMEVRRGLPYRDVENGLRIQKGALEINGLKSGDYVLADYESGQKVRLFVVDDKQSDLGIPLVGKWRNFERVARQELVIREARLDGETLELALDGFDPATHVNIVAEPFVSEGLHARRYAFPFAPILSNSRQPVPSFFVDSLKLDEEYSYILNRQTVRKFPGNLLPQPTVLINPWELSRTDNASKQAAAGDMLPPAAAPAPMAAEAADPRGAAARINTLAASTYDFLSRGTQVASNLTPDKDGKIKFSVQGLQGYSRLEIIAVHPTAVDSRILVLPETAVPRRDQRLKQSFPDSTHLTEKQTVRVLKAGEKAVLGDARTSRVQLYTTLADVFRLYGTLLNQADWEKFRFLSNWPALSGDEKQARYNEYACHELDYFLYHKDRKFFDEVVRPLLAHKVDKQLVDQWLLGLPIDEHRELWRLQRLNTLERVLLSQSVAEHKSGTARWLAEFLAANPLDRSLRSQRFEVALRGTLLDGEGGLMKNIEMDGMVKLSLQDSESRKSGNANRLRGMFGANAPAGGAPGSGAMSGYASEGMGMEGGGMGMGGGGMGGAGAARSLSLGRPAPGKPSGAGKGPSQPGGKDKKQETTPTAGIEAEMDFDSVVDRYARNEFFQSRRLAEGEQLLRERFFQNIEPTREWAETQYYRVRLENQVANLVPPGVFWQEYLNSDTPERFLSQNLDLPVSSVNEALLALAVLNLPWTADAPEMVVENDRLVVTSKSDAIAYVQSIETAEVSKEAVTILAGQDIYLAQPTSSEEAVPVQSQPLLINTPYRTSVVVTNPTSKSQRVQVLCQLPQGAIPLAGSKVTRSTPVDLAPYSTAQVQYTFYFPESGVFSHYGAQVSSESLHLAATASSKLRVLAEPESVDETTWAYIADWASNEKVLDYLGKANLQKLDLARIAFRMSDKAFYTSVVGLLSKSGHFVPELWAYSVRHNVAHDVEQLLQQRKDFTGQLGPNLESSLLVLHPSEQMSYEHLDYKPLVVARTHQLGTTRVILNDSLYKQYMGLLNGIAHQKQVQNSQRMELCYYLLLQNRVDEALTWFESIELEALPNRIQYDYFHAYLDFYRGQYDRAGEISSRYASYPVPRWRDLFAQVTNQLKQRQAVVEGVEIASVTSLDSHSEREQKVLTDRREAQQTQLAAEAPALDFTIAEGVPTISYRNLEQVQVNYYLMDIELLFSRNPFVGQTGNRLPAIRPNLTQTLKVGATAAAQKLELPADVRNRNVLIEVSSRGISRSQVLTANTLSISISESFGRMQVQSLPKRQPVEMAYIKVYARHQDGSIRFFKDGYTDLRGQFDYATLSTPDLNTVERFAILVLHPEHGAIVREASPPTR